MLRSQPGPGPLLQAALDPLMAIATLAGAAAFFGAAFDGACLILALLVFAMTFPGGVSGEAGRARLPGKVIANTSSARIRQAPSKLEPNSAVTPASVAIATAGSTAACSSAAAPGWPRIRRVREPGRKDSGSEAKGQRG